MDRADALILQNAEWESEHLEDVGLRRLVLELYDVEHIALRRYLAFLGVDVENGRDLLQEAFLKLHQHLIENGDRSNLRAWLYRVVHNLARNSQVAHSAAKTDYLPDIAVTGDIASADHSIEQKLLRSERQRNFLNALANLSPSQRECLALRSRGLKYREIAEVLDLSVSSVGENIQRGLERLRRLLELQV